MGQKRELLDSNAINNQLNLTFYNSLSFYYSTAYPWEMSYFLKVQRFVYSTTNQDSPLAREIYNSPGGITFHFIKEYIRETFSKNVG